MTANALIIGVILILVMLGHSILNTEGDEEKQIAITRPIINSAMIDWIQPLAAAPNKPTTQINSNVMI